MNKNVALMVLMLLFLPALASAGLISIAVSGVGGSITGTPTSGFVSTAKTYTLNAATNYTLNYVTNNGNTVSATPVDSSHWTYTIPYSGSAQTVYVYFKLATVSPPQLVASLPSSITTAVNTATILSGATSTISNLAPGTKAKFKFTSADPHIVFTPISSSVTSPSNIVTSFTTSSNSTYTTTLTLSAPGATPSTANVSIIIQLPGIAASYPCLQCHAGEVEANAYALSPHASTTFVTCQACHNPGLLLQHPGYSISNTTANPGLFYSCVTCHTPGNPYGLPWPPPGLSFHNAYTGTNLCTQCHDPHTTAFISGNLPYPHFSTFSTAQFVTRNISCDNCHTSAVNNSFNIYSANYQWAKSGKGNPKSPAYIGPGPYTEANLEAYDFKFLGTALPATPATTISQDCVRCHTTTGYVNYVNSNFTDIHAWGTPGDRTREMIACNACHNNTTGFDATFSRRSVGVLDVNSDTSVVQAWYNYSSAATKKIIRSKLFVNPSDVNMYDSNICIACHSGKAAGDLIKQTTISNGSAVCSSLPSIVCRLGDATTGLTGPFWANVNFIDPHGMGSANLMIPDALRAGYEYRTGNTSTSTNHSGIGIGSQGPCVGCHMSSPKKHLFSPVSSASNGVITAITTTLCSSCHGVNGPAFLINNAGVLETKKEGYQAALAVITAQLAAKGIYYNTAIPPYFFTSAVPASQTFATRTVNWNINGTFQGANLMGAAFNLRLLQSDAGWVHNGTTAKRLLYDTIDYLDDGLQNNTVSTAIQNLGIDQATKDKAAAYIGTRP